VQGFHVMSDGTSGFGAFTADVLTHLQDEYSSRPILLFNVSPPPNLGASALSRVGEWSRLATADGIPPRDVLAPRCVS
jgi:hypothetical protein